MEFEEDAAQARSDEILQALPREELLRAVVQTSDEPVVGFLLLGFRQDAEGPAQGLAERAEIEREMEEFQKVNGES